jgi:very-short-patch-repair endonuclease
MEAAFPTYAELLAHANRMRASPTEAEERLWSMLRNRRLETYKFKWKRIIAPYIVDFVCLSSWLIIEADGSQHPDSRDDERRDSFLERAGFRVLRFWNNDVLGNSDGVFDAICAALTDPHPPTAARWSPSSPRQGDGLEGVSLA